MITARIRVHEWLADHFRFIQYPDVRAIHRARVASMAGPKMPFATRVIVAVLSLAVGLVGIGCVAIGAFILYSLAIG